MPHMIYPEAAPRRRAMMAPYTTTFSDSAGSWRQKPQSALK